MDIFLVGGAVRDKLLGYPFSDRDWVVVGATPEQLLKQGFQPVGKDFPVFLHPDSKEEYALARTERKVGAGYTGFQCYSSPDVTIEEDLMRRDLTVNAIAEAEDGTLIDPFNGQQDIHDRYLRHVSDAFIEDPLRVLRCARFLARYFHLGFRIADETIALSQQISASGELQHLSKERVWQELEKALGERSPEQYFIALQDCHAANIFWPQLNPLSEQQINLLQQAAAQPAKTSSHNQATDHQTMNKPQRFAMLFFHLSEADSKAVLAQLKAPNEFKELALMVSQFGLRCVQLDSNNSEQKLRLIESLDAFRRPERLQLFLACCSLYSGIDNQQKQLSAAYFASKSIEAKSLAEQGLRGAEIAKALREKRLQAIDQLQAIDS
mgnify:CR=1 FL=1